MGLKNENLYPYKKENQKYQLDWMSFKRHLKMNVELGTQSHLKGYIKS